MTEGGEVQKVEEKYAVNRESRREIIQVHIFTCFKRSAGPLTLCVCYLLLWSQAAFRTSDV